MQHCPAQRPEVIDTHLFVPTGPRSLGLPRAAETRARAELVPLLQSHRRAQRRASMQPCSPGSVVLGLACTLIFVGTARAGDMDPELSRLSVPAGAGTCPADGLARVCADNASFELLTSELAGALAPMVSSGAATGGARGFYLGLSSTVSTLRSSASYWARGTRGADSTAPKNAGVDALLSYHRLEARKGLPFGLEVGASAGFGLHTSLWVLAAEVKLALFEGFRSGLGALPDVALRAVTQAVVGSPQLSLQTQALDVILSKPLVLRQEHTLTPLLALQLLFVSAHSAAVDFTPQTSALSACAPNMSDPSASCPNVAEQDLYNTSTFRSVSRTRVRMFVGAQERYRMLSIALTLGLDLVAPPVPQATGDEPLPPNLLRQFSLQLAGGLRY